MLKDYEYTYYVDEKEKQIICRITKKKDPKLNHYLAAHDFCIELIRTTPGGNFSFVPVIDLLPSQCVAIAKCHPGDTFSEETGKRVARNKLRRRLVKAVYAMLREEVIKLTCVSSSFFLRNTRDLAKS